jgi:thiosulfate/3-mercaptopyruvate sulfurtransferase
VLISAAELATSLADPRPPVVLDVRWQLSTAATGPYDGHADYLRGHVPGAVFVDLDTELAAHGDPTHGRHPLPSPEAFEASMRGWGIDDGSRVVVYDATGSMAAARAWWMLRWAGLPDVRLLDGGWTAWQAHGGDQATDDVRPAPGTVTFTSPAMPTIGAEEAGGWSVHGVLVDARAPERFRGEVEPIDPVAGHIPGAVNVPTAGNLDADGRFLPAEVLRDRFVRAGITADTPVAAYCGSGVTAAHEIAAMAIAGIDAALYPGSWSQWSNLGLPAETASDR